MTPWGSWLLVVRIGLKVLVVDGESCRHQAGPSRVK
jgi:hypothetical protein